MKFKLWNYAINFRSGELRESSKNGFSGTEVTNISKIRQHASFCWVNYKLLRYCRMTVSSCLIKSKCNFFQRVNQSTPPRISHFKNYHQRTHLNLNQLLPAASNRCSTYSRHSPILHCPSHLSGKWGEQLLQLQRSLQKVWHQSCVFPFSVC